MSNGEFIFDWNRFNGFMFQDMCNHLLVMENILTVPFKSGPYADEGQDARLFEGTIGNISGRIIFQAKYHKPRPGKKNINALRSDIKGTPSKKGELAKAEEAVADHLVVMTNVPLIGPRQHDDFSALADGYRVRLYIWDEEKIKALLIKHPYVRFFHIKGPEFPMFVPHDHFFNKYLMERPEDIFTHRTILSGRDHELTRFRDWLSSQANVFVTYGAPGQGKSRLAIEFSKIAKPETDWEPLFVRPDGRLLKDHLEELNPNNKYLLIMEDVHRVYERLGEFLQLLERETDTPGLKMVLTARTSFRGLVEEALARLQPFEVHSISLRPLPKEQILKILSDQLPGYSDIHLKDLLPIVKDSPLMAVTAARLIKTGKPLVELLEPGQLRDLLFEIPLLDLTKYCRERGENYALYLDILTLIAALQPVSVKDEKLLSKIAGYLKMKQHELRKALDILTKLGFLKPIGRKLRLMPESLSDIILEKQCIVSDGETSGMGEEVAGLFFEDCPERLLDNMSDIGMIAFQEKRPDILKTVFENIKRRAREKDNFGRYMALGHLKIVASRRSADVLEAAEIILNNPVQNSDSEEFMSHASILGMVTGILTDVARNPDYIQDAIWMLKRLALKENVEGNYVDTKPDNALKEVVSYDVGKYVQFQEIAVETMTKWKGENAEAYALAVRSIQPVLNRAVGFTRSYGATVTFGSAQLAASPPVIALREKAHGFIQDALKSGIRNVQVAALEVCSEIGSLGKGPGPPEGSAGKITEIIENERFGILEVLQELIEQKAVGLDLTARIERLLWDWWWSKTEKISSKCFEIIKKIDATLNYNLYKLLYIDDCPVMADLAVAGKLQTSEDRRKFYFKSKDRREGKKFIEQTISAVGDLSNNEHWAQVIYNCGKEAGREASSWSYGNVLRYLAEQNPTLAYSLYARKKDKPWDRYGSILLTGARSGNPDTWAEFLRPISENVTTYEVSSLRDCIQAINEDDLSTQEIDFLKKCSKQPSEEVRLAVANKVGIIRKVSWPLAEELSGKLVEKPVSQEILDRICSALLHNRPDEFKRNPTTTERRILNAFKDIEEIKKFWCLEYV